MMTTAENTLTQPPAKRSKCIDVVWQDVVSWVEGNGGYVHPFLKFDNDERCIQISCRVIAETHLLKIPSKCLLTIDTLKVSEYGRNILQALDQVKNNLHLDRNDLAIALFMAHLDETKSTNDDKNSDMLRDRSCSFFAPYISSLPKSTISSSPYNALPRRWSEELLEELLGGTALHKRVLQERKDLRSDFDTILMAWSDTNVKLSSMKDSQSSSLTPFARFDDMYAAVASRGFAGLGSNDGKMDAMVPVLDLLDHKRGVTRGTKDVSYKRLSHKNDSLTMVLVSADRELDTNSVLCDTYGAKGNSQLLSRYGFCIEDNVEPDGSSNDVLEFHFKTDNPPIELRAGPKSYSYGGFVRALEQFYENENDKDDNKPSSTRHEDKSRQEMDDFLDQYDDQEEEGEQEEGEMQFDAIYGEGGDDDDKEFLDSDMKGPHDEAGMLAECAALKRFDKSLERTLEGYALRGEKLEEAFKCKIESPSYYAAILVKSEMRTISLFQQAIRKLLSKLVSKESMETDMYADGNSNEGDIEFNLVNIQSDDLVNAYLTIRHPGKLL